MSQSLARIHIHLIFATKRREPCIGDPIRGSLHAYLSTVLRNLGCPVVLVNSVEDHVHILFELARSVPLCAAAEEAKKSSSRWMKVQGITAFAWQGGYGAFSVSASQVPKVESYIANQREHHHRMSFQDEFRAFLERHRIAVDDHRLWE